MDGIHLVEDDIPGSALGIREPSHLTNKELKFWLACRGLKTSKLKTKAALVAKVIEMKDQNLPLVDPTMDQIYLQMKRTLAGLPNVSPQENNQTLKMPKSGWTKELENLPQFSDVNIMTYSRKSGKKVDRKNSSIECAVAQKTCERPETRGYKFFFEKYIHDIWFCKEDGHAFFKAKCFRSQRTKETPHHLWCALSCSLPADVFHAYCSCIAGASGFCNHIFGLLYQIGHFSKAGTTKIPPEISRTSEPQLWDKPRLLGISPQPIMDVVHKKASSDQRKRKVLQSTLYEARSDGTIPNDSHLLKVVQKRITKINPLIGITYMAIPDSATTEYLKNSTGTYVPIGSVLSYQLAVTEGNFTVDCNFESIESFPCSDKCDVVDFPALPTGNGQLTVNFDTLDQDHKSFIEGLIISHKDAVHLEERTRSQTSSDLWWNARKERVTASNFGEICKRKANSGKLADRLATQKKKNINAPSLNHGRDHEEMAAQKYKKFMSNSGHAVEVLMSGFVVDPNIPYLGCTPDRKVIDPKAHPHFGLAEIKCPYKHRNVTPYEASIADKEFCCEVKDGKISLKKNHGYHYQIQGQMALTGLKWCDFIAYTFKGMHIERIYFDNDFWNNAVNKLEQFYFSQFIPSYKRNLETEKKMVGGIGDILDI